NLSVLDGWWIEGYDGESGWAISSPEGDAAVQDDHDALALYDLLEHEIVPLFYARDPDGLPRRWIARIKVSMQRLIPRFSAERMVAEYLGALYGAGEVHGWVARCRLWRYARMAGSRSPRWISDFCERPRSTCP